MQFDRVYILGLAEGQLPPPVRIDALLPDDEREGLGLPPFVEAAAEDHRRYLAALASAPHRTLLFAHADLRAGRPQQPSRWLLESATQLAGEPVTGASLASHEDAPWLTLLPSFPSALTGHREPASPQELDLRLLLEGPSQRLANPLLALPEFKTVVRGIEAAHARAVRTRGPSPGLSRWEAAVGSIASPASESAAPVSPTALERMATCPFSYFLRHVLGVRELEEPPDEIRISPLVRGALVHRILERFFVEAAASASLPAADEPWDEAAHARMEAIALEECVADEAHGLTGAPLLWQLEQRRILDALKRFLEQDDQRRAAGFTFAGAEMSFGEPGNEVVLPLDGGRAIRFRGRIDRIDRAPDGRVMVYDYKTGGMDGFKDVENGDFAQGRHLQLPVYALALGAGQGVRVSANYWFLVRENGFQGYEVDATRLTSFAEVVDDLDATISSGLFPGNPGVGQRDNCKYCAFERVCPPRATRLPRLLQRSAATPGLGRYARLANLANLGDDDLQEEDDVID
jgi:RecB family exonuclease